MQLEVESIATPASTPLELCEPHLDRGMRVPSTRNVGGTLMCDRCFRGRPVLGLELEGDPPGRRGAPKKVTSPLSCRIRRGVDKLEPIDRKLQRKIRKQKERECLARRAPIPLFVFSGIATQSSISETNGELAR